MRGPTPAGNRIHSLTGCRFLAAGLVFAFHLATLQIFTANSAADTALTVVTKSAGTIGVSFFFVLSGFVLTWSARDGDTYPGFLRRRLVKIYPNHLVTFVLALAVFAAAATTPGQAIVNALLLHAWVPDPDVFLGVNGPSWSLSCELFFYALFPLLLKATGRIAAERLWRWAGLVVLVIVVLPWAALLLPAGPAYGGGLAGTVLGGQSITRMWFLYIFPPVRLLDFVLGVLLARLVLSGRWRGPGVRVSGVLVVLAYVAGLFTPLTFTVDAVTVVPLALLIAALATADSRGAPTVLGRPAMRRLGEISFALYLVQEIVLVALRAAVGFDRRLPVLPGLAFVLVAALAALLVAAALHRGVEAPLVRAWGRRTAPAPGPSLDRSENASAVRDGR
jgi:peptidoglycan/LPS O-acetylase OafA/YrhL